MLSEQGVREVTLLGQNVNSYADFSSRASSSSSSSGGSSSSSAQAAAADDPFAGVYARGFRRWARIRASLFTVRLGGWPLAA